MASIREQILLAFKAALEGSGAPAGLTVHRYRTRELSADDLPAVGVFPVAERSGEGDLDGLVRRLLLVQASCRVQGDPPDAALDPIYVWVVKAVKADPTFGGLAIHTQEVAARWNAEAAEAVYGGLDIDFQIQYYTTGDDPENSGE